MTTNPNYLPTSHPVRALLRAAVGNELSRADLARLDEHDPHLPPGHSLSKYGPKVAEAAAKVRALASTGQHGRARALADDLAADLAGRMSEQERAALGDANPESVDDITRRMFGN